MIEMKGKYTDCKIFSDQVEESALSQVQAFLDHPAFEGKKTRFMPDIHAGSGAVIGTTVELGDKVIPNVVGTDIGCGMTSWNLGRSMIDFEKLDEYIRERIPHGTSTHQSPISDKRLKRVFSTIKNPYYDCYGSFYNHLRLTIKSKRKHLNKSHRIYNSIGTLGGGNHFVEIGQDEENCLWLTIHSGSRNFGLQIATMHQEKAERTMSLFSSQEFRDEIEKIKLTHKGVVIAKAIQELKERSKVKNIPKGMEYLEGDNLEKYLKHMNLAQVYAQLNRRIMGIMILEEFLNVHYFDPIESVHNYIDFEDGIIRKGAISAKKDEIVIIPWNMRDGLIIGKGKGNPDWNFSAPHGAGRVMSRNQAKKEVALADFEESMKDIYSTSVGESTLDESPFAYKDHEEIEKYLGETVEIVHRVKPLYNFKA